MSPSDVASSSVRNADVSRAVCSSLRPQTLQFSSDGLELDASLIPLTQRAIDRLLKLASRRLLSLCCECEVLMALLELEVMLLHVLLEPIDVLPLHVDLVLEGLASRL